MTIILIQHINIKGGRLWEVPWYVLTVHFPLEMRSVKEMPCFLHYLRQIKQTILTVTVKLLNCGHWLQNVSPDSFCTCSQFNVIILPISPSNHLSTCIYLSIYLSIYLTIYLSACLPACLSVFIQTTVAVLLHWWHGSQYYSKFNYNNKKL